MKDNAWTLTYSQMQFHPFHPKPEEINIKDIAHGLSNLCRFSGQCKFFFSVAQHSLNAMKYAKRKGYSQRIQLLCLLHDAAEAYISDVPAPLKAHLPEFSMIEAKIMNAIYSALEISIPNEDEQKIIDIIDKIMLATEAKLLLHNAYKWWEELNQMESDEKMEIRELSIQQIRSRFMYEFMQLNMNL